MDRPMTAKSFFETGLDGGFRTLEVWTGRGASQEWPRVTSRALERCRVDFQFVSISNYLDDKPLKRDHSSVVSYIRVIGPPVPPQRLRRHTSRQPQAERSSIA